MKLWKYIFRPVAKHTDLAGAARAADSAGYRMFVFNGVLYGVTDPHDGLPEAWELLDRAAMEDIGLL